MPYLFVLKMFQPFSKNPVYLLSDSRLSKNMFIDLVGNSGRQHR